MKRRTGRKVKYLNATGVSDGRYYADDRIEIAVHDEGRCLHVVRRFTGGASAIELFEVVPHAGEPGRSFEMRPSAPRDDAHEDRETTCFKVISLPGNSIIDSVSFPSMLDWHITVLTINISKRASVEIVNFFIKSPGNFWLNKSL